MTREDRTPYEWRGIDDKNQAAEEFLESPSRDTLYELLTELWGVQKGVNNVEYFLDEYYLSDQTPQEIATAIEEAVYAGEAEILVEMDGFGWPVATEVLSALEPEEFVLLNRRSAEGLEELGYDAPNPKSANAEQYEEFSEKVKRAVEEYPLKEATEREKGEEAPDGTSPYLIIDLWFAYLYDDDKNMSIPTKQRGGIGDVLNDELKSEVKETVDNNPEYRDVEDFLYSAVRNELRQSQ